MSEIPRNHLYAIYLFGDLATVMKTKRTAIWTSQKSVPSLNKWPRTIAITIGTSKKLIDFSRLIVCFRYKVFSFTSSAQFSNGSYY